MRRFMIIGGVLAITLFGAVAVMPALAVTLPAVLFLAGKTSAVAKASSTSVTSLETVIGSKISGKGVEGTLTATTNGSALGTYVLVFKEVAEGVNKCKTGTLAAGNVEYKGEFHLVTISEAPLTIGLLYLVPTTTVLCGSTEKPERFKIKIEGGMLASFGGTVNSESKEFTTSLKGTKGKPEKATYLNDAGESQHVSLKANFGLGAEECIENVAEPMTFTSEGLTVDG